jgi:hypothetical protein
VNHDPLKRFEILGVVVKGWTAGQFRCSVQQATICGFQKANGPADKACKSKNLLYAYSFSNYMNA